jgi:hypothetical protein
VKGVVDVALRVERATWVVRDGSDTAVNVKSGVVVTIDEADPGQTRLFARALSGADPRAAAVELGRYNTHQEAVAALDQIVRNAG